MVLKKIKKCWVTITTRITGKKEDGNFKEVNKLGLAFAYKGNGQAEIVWEFYNSDKSSSSLTSELELAETGCKIANDKIKSIS